MADDGHTIDIGPVTIDERLPVADPIDTDAERVVIAGTEHTALTARYLDALVEVDRLRAENEHYNGMECPMGCGCRLGTDDADPADCACDGPCCWDDFNAWLTEGDYSLVPKAEVTVAPPTPCGYCGRPTVAHRLDDGEVALRVLRSLQGHVIEFDADGWAIQHSLSCRTDLLNCPAQKSIKHASALWAEAPRPYGRYTLRAMGDNWVIGLHNLPKDVPVDPEAADLLARLEADRG